MRTLSYAVALAAALPSPAANAQFVSPYQPPQIYTTVPQGGGVSRTLGPSGQIYTTVPQGGGVSRTIVTPGWGQ
jgi:hypothetical protein